MNEPAPHPSYARLKLYRTYFRLVRADAAAHRFTVWFDDVEPCHWEVGAPSLDDVASATFREGFGGFSVAPLQVPPLPENVAVFGEALVGRVLGAHPRARSVRVRYEGHLREFAVAEVTPTTDHGELGDRLIGTARAILVQAAGDVELQAHPKAVQVLAAISSFGSLDGCHEPPRWIDFRLPPAQEGTSLLTARELDRSVPPELWRRFSAAVLEAADGNPASLDGLLAAQGDEVLPADFASEVTFRITAYGRRAQQVADGGLLRFSLADADRDQAMASWRGERLGLQVRGELSLRKGTLRLEVTPASGPAQRLEGRLLTREPLLRDGPRVAVRGASLGVTFHPELRRPSGGQLSFEGDDRFERIDVHTDGDLRMAVTRA